MSDSDTQPTRRRQQMEHTYDPTNEGILIGAALAIFFSIPSAEVPDEKWRELSSLVRSIAADEFLVKENSVVWLALRTMVEKRMPYESLVFQRLVADQGVVLPAGTLESMEANAYVPENLQWTVEVLRVDALKARVLQGVIPEIISQLRSPKATLANLSTTVRALQRSVEGVVGRRHIHRPDEFARSYKADVAARRAVSNFRSFGWGEPVDALLSEGAMGGLTSVIAGLSGSGKSTYALAAAAKLANMGRRVLYCPWEMGAKRSMDILVAGMTRIELDRVVKGRLGSEVLLSDEETTSINRATDWICQRIKWMDNPFFEFNREQRRSAKGKYFRASNDDNLDLLEEYIAESGCDVVVMDLWERMLVDRSYQGVTDALNRQQQMHKDYNVYGVLLQQINGKEVEKRADKRPRRDDIRGVGGFVDIADQVFILHREGQFKKVPDDVMELMCLKQRNGKPNWCVGFDWHGEMALMTNPRQIDFVQEIEGVGAGDNFVGRLNPGKRKLPNRRD